MSSSFTPPFPLFRHDKAVRTHLSWQPATSLRRFLREGVPCPPHLSPDSSIFALTVVAAIPSHEFVAVAKYSDLSLFTFQARKFPLSFMPLTGLRDKEAHHYLDTLIGFFWPWRPLFTFQHPLVSLPSCPHVPPVTKFFSHFPFSMHDSPPSCSLVFFLGLGHMVFLHFPF